MATLSSFGSLLLVLALVAPAKLRAQQVPTSATGTTVLQPTTSSRALLYKAAPAEQRATRMSQEISRELNLDAATTAKVQAAALTRCQQIDAIQNGTASNKDKNKALEANAKSFKAALQGILTPAQYAQYTSHSGSKRSQAKADQPAATPAN